MLSYNTLLAIRLLYVLHETKGRKLTISELKYECNLRDPGNAAGRVVRTLRKGGWVESDSRNRYRLVVDPDEKSLLDLVIEIDEAVRLGGNDLAVCREIIDSSELPWVDELNERLWKECVACLKGINLGELIAGRAAENSLQTYESAQSRSRTAGW